MLVFGMVSGLGFYRISGSGFGVRGSGLGFLVSGLE